MRFASIGLLAVSLLAVVGETKAAVGSGRDAEPPARSWAFDPLRRAEPPVVRDTAWPSSPIDRFVLARLEQAGLSPSRDADRETLLRRATFDLIGLPPTLDEIDAFLADRSPHAFARVVDRLLASPYFGERWGRHWLDVARYADSSGGGRTLEFPNAWRYRDYVIRAFNTDKPYDRFVAEQIAGDLMPWEAPDQRADRLVATGFLTLGPTNYELQDKELLRMEVVDEQLDTMGRAILGLTIGCARCHDHRFDPIPTADYYALAGIFRSTKTLTPGNVSGFVEQTLPVSRQRRESFDAHQRAVKAVEARINAAKKQVAQLEKKVAKNAAAGAQSEDGTAGAGAEVSGTQVAKLEEKMADVRAALKRDENELKLLKKAAPPPLPKAMSVHDEAEIEDSYICVAGDVHEVGENVPRGFLGALPASEPVKIGPDQSGRLQLAEWLTDPDNPLPARVISNRVWHHLFGQGIVRTVDHFGSLGEKPSHPELLDYLATQLAANDWSLKRLLRQVMLSRVYGLSGQPPERAADVDPDNRLISYRPRRRAEAESLRDAILAISGQLDRAAGGRAVNPTAATPGQATFSSRRSVYLRVLRNELHPLFEVFDMANPNLVTGRRATSTLPTQALYLMNSPFVIEQAHAVAERLLDQPVSNNPQRVHMAYRWVLGRQPSEREERLALQYLDGFVQHESDNPSEEGDPALDAWTSLFQTLFACVDFRFLN